MPLPIHSSIANIIIIYLKPLALKTSRSVDSIVTPQVIVYLATLFEEKKINNQGIQKSLELLAESSEIKEYNSLDDFSQFLKTNNLLQVTDTSLLSSIVKNVIDHNPQPVADYKAGKEQSIGYLIGQCMKEAKGSGNPQIFKELLISSLQ